MRTGLLTLPQFLRMNGYRTGIFGKWHLGDKYPLRAIDQGFEEALVLRGGGIGQPSDPPGGESYFNPILQHNGKAVALTFFIVAVMYRRKPAVAALVAAAVVGGFYLVFPFALGVPLP